MFTGYVNFIAKENILSVAIAMIVSNLVLEIINKIKDDIILPISHLNLKELVKNFSITEYIGLGLNFFLQTFIIYSLFGSFL